MDNNSFSLRSILINYHFKRIFEEVGETDLGKQKLLREQFGKSVEQDVDKMLREEFEIIAKDQKREAKNIVQLVVWTTLQVIGNGALAYSINLENIIFVAFSIATLVAVTVWFWVIQY